MNAIEPTNTQTFTGGICRELYRIYIGLYQMCTEGEMRSRVFVPVFGYEYKNIIMQVNFG